MSSELGQTDLITLFMTGGKGGGRVMSWTVNSLIQQDVFVSSEARREERGESE